MYHRGEVHTTNQETDGRLKGHPTILPICSDLEIKTPVFIRNDK